MPTSSTPAPETLDLGCVTVEPVRRADETIDWRATQAKLEDAYAGFPPDPESGAPAWNAAYNTLWAQEQERAIDARMEAVEGRIALPREYLAVVGAEGQHHGGYVENAEAARSNPCTRLNLGPGRRPLVFAKGVIGALSEEQIEEFCAEFVDKEASPSQQARLTAFGAASHNCSLATRDASPEDHLSLYFSCIGKELREQGVEG